MSGVYMEELEYDIQELFIIGYEPNEIAEQLDVSDGKKPKYSADTAKEIYEQVFWIKDQIEEAVADSLDFTKG